MPQSHKGSQLSLQPQRVGRQKQENSEVKVCMSHRTSSRAGVNSARLAQREGSGMWGKGRELVWPAQDPSSIFSTTKENKAKLSALIYNWKRCRGVSAGAAIR